MEKYIGTEEKKQQRYCLTVQRVYYDAIVKGNKLKEGRTNSGIAKEIQPGDVVEFIPDDEELSNERYAVTVKKVVAYKSFGEMLSHEGMLNLLPESNLNLAEAVDLYRGFPSYKEREALHGVLSINF